MKLGFIATVLVFFAGVVAAQVPSGPEFEQRLKKLETELRCLVCQNQTLADSNAGLAEDLRREVRELAEKGKSDEEIKTYLQARYGDFVLYNPPVKEITWLLWFGPFVLLALGALVFALLVRRRSVAAQGSHLNEAERKQAEDLLS
jgi:cytochrome c-type biogenesis protein CcmH